jgi:UDP-N-acetylmuramate dehydrogenase
MFTIYNNISLKPFNTFNVDVQANRLLILHSEQDVEELLRNKIDKSYGKIIIGTGSNLLFTKDFTGLILKMNNKGISILESGDEEVIIEAAAGESWDDLVKYTIENNYYGLENLSMIPGTVGASPVQNIGAYGVELKDVFHSLSGYNLENGESQEFKKEECKFSYRDSIFKYELINDFLITRVRIKLSKRKKLNLSYKSLSEALKYYSENEIDLNLVSDTVRNIRKSKLPDSDILGNAGSFFKNPEVDIKTYNRLKQNFPKIVTFQSEGERIKISAGWLIEQCGFKGKRIGNVSTYDKQALVIVNHGNATGKEILDYASLIIEKVFKIFEVNLEYEINII